MSKNNRGKSSRHLGRMKQKWARAAESKHKANQRRHRRREREPDDPR